MASSVILKGNSNSAMIGDMDAKLQSPLDYYVYKNYPNLATSLVPIPNSNTSGTFAGITNAFKLNRVGKISDLSIESAITGTVTTVANVNNEQMGGKLFASVELKTNGKTIYKQDQHSVLCKQDYARADEGLALSTAMNNDTIYVTTVSLAQTYYTPIMAPFFQDKGSYLDSNFIEQLNVVAVGNSLANMGMTTITASTLQLWVSYYNLEDKVEEELRSANFKGDKPLMYFGYTFNTEPFNCTATTTQTVSLYPPGVVPRMWIYCMNTTNGQRVDFGAGTTVTLKIAGVVHLDQVPVKVLSNIASRAGSAGVKYIGVGATAGTLTKWAIRPILLDFTLLEGVAERASELFKAGGIDFEKQTGILLTINHPNVTTSATDHSIFVVEEVNKLFKVDQVSGAFSDAS